MCVHKRAPKQIKINKSARKERAKRQFAIAQIYRQNRHKRKAIMRDFAASDKVDCYLFSSMYFTTSPTVLSVATVSSSATRPYSSSIAMTSSTTSRLSSPKSLTMSLSSVTRLLSMPSWLAMMSLTVSKIMIVCSFAPIIPQIRLAFKAKKQYVRRF